jgi:hypothetical protein
VETSRPLGIVIVAYVSVGAGVLGAATSALAWWNSLNVTAPDFPQTLLEELFVYPYAKALFALPILLGLGATVCGLGLVASRHWAATGLRITAAASFLLLCLAGVLACSPLDTRSLEDIVSVCVFVLLVASPLVFVLRYLQRPAVLDVLKRARRRTTG